MHNLKVAIDTNTSLDFLAEVSMEVALLMKEIETLPDPVQEIVFYFVQFMKEQEEKAALLAQLSSAFAIEWLNDPEEDIYE